MTRRDAHKTFSKTERGGREEKRGRSPETLVGSRGNGKVTSRGHKNRRGPEPTTWRDAGGGNPYFCAEGASCAPQKEKPAAPGYSQKNLHGAGAI